MLIMTNNLSESFLLAEQIMGTLNHNMNMLCCTVPKTNQTTAIMIIVFVRRRISKKNYMWTFIIDFLFFKLHTKNNIFHVYNLFLGNSNNHNDYSLLTKHHRQKPATAVKSPNQTNY